MLGEEMKMTLFDEELLSVEEGNKKLILYREGKGILAVEEEWW